MPEGAFYRPYDYMHSRVGEAWGLHSSGPSFKFYLLQCASDSRCFQGKFFTLNSGWNVFLSWLCSNMLGRPTRLPALCFSFPPGLLSSSSFCCIPPPPAPPPPPTRPESHCCSHNYPFQSGGRRESCTGSGFVFRFMYRIQRGCRYVPANCDVCCSPFAVITPTPKVEVQARICYYSSWDLQFCPEKCLRLFKKDY